MRDTVDLCINKQIVKAQRGWTLLETLKFYGIDVPTLCYHEGLSAWGGCRLCVVEVGEGRNVKLVTSCTYPATEGLVVETHSMRVMNARKMLAEILLATCPTSKTVQDIAASLGVQKTRFELRNEKCILCGLCVRICSEQMGAKAIGFASRGGNVRVTTPFDRTSEECRRCGACMYICPACQLRCDGPNPARSVCGACLTVTPGCLPTHENLAFHRHWNKQVDEG